MSTNQSASVGFWETTLGIITKLTAIVTALTGLVLAVKPLFSKPETSTDNITSMRYENTHSNTPRFPEASQRILTAQELMKIAKQDLKIMRNEIYARHGYIFKTAAMKNYFTGQSWYHPKYEDVTAMLSDIEKQNIQLITQLE